MKVTDIPLDEICKYVGIAHQTLSSLRVENEGRVFSQNEVNLLLGFTIGAMLTYDGENLKLQDDFEMVYAVISSVYMYGQLVANRGKTLENGNKILESFLKRDRDA